MVRTLAYCTLLLLLTDSAMGGEAADEDKLLSGMSIVGNDEAPKSLVIVPWKSSPAPRQLVQRTLDLRQCLDFPGFGRAWKRPQHFS